MPHLLGLKLKLLVSYDFDGALGVGAGEVSHLPARLEPITHVSYEIDGAGAGAGLEGCPTCLA